MAAATSSDHHQRQHLPPSPPPSPPSPRRRHKKKPDPFEDLAWTPVSSRPGTPITEPTDEQESLLTKIILTPVLFTSFLLSLFLVDYRNRARRTEAHSSHALLEYFYPSTWLDPEPYQDPGDSTWGRSGSVGHVEPHDAIGPTRDGHSDGGKGKGKRKSWHLNKKIRKVASLEIGDAFEMRGRVIAGIVVVILLSSIALCMGLRWLLASFSAMLFSASS